MDRVAEAQRLRDEGLFYGQIAERFGVAKSTVYRWLNPEYYERSLRRSVEYKRRHRRRCEGCGLKVVNISADGDLCVDCFNAHLRETSAEWLIDEMQRWDDLYGEQPTASDWNLQLGRYQQRAYAEGRAIGRPSDARLAEQERRHCEDGPWPTTGAVQHIFGSWNAGIEAAGFEPRPPVGTPNVVPGGWPGG